MESKTEEESREVKRAQYEIDLVGLSDQDSDYGGMIGDAVMQLIKLFSAQSHSGFSASMTGSIFYRLVQGKALTPVTNDPSEWLDVTEIMYDKEVIAKGNKIWQNTRQGSVFSKDGGKTWEDMSDNSKGTSISREEALDGINSENTKQTKSSSSEVTSGEPRSTEAETAGGLQGESTTEPKDSEKTSDEKEPRDVEGSE